MINPRKQEGARQTTKRDSKGDGVGGRMANPVLRMENSRVGRKTMWTDICVQDGGGGGEGRQRLEIQEIG